MSDDEFDDWMQKANDDMREALGREIDAEAGLRKLKQRVAVEGEQPPFTHVSE